MAYSTNCKSNQKQLGLIIGMYASDYKDFFPTFTIRLHTPTPWYVMMQTGHFNDKASGSNLKLWDCPGDKTRTPNTKYGYYQYWWTSVYREEKRYINRSYSFERTLGLLNSGSTFHYPFCFSKEKKISRVLIMMDVEPVETSTPQAYYWGYDYSQLCYIANGKHHGGYVNLLAGDLSVAQERSRLIFTNASRYTRHSSYNTSVTYP